MTYGLVYRPVNMRPEASTAQSTVQSTSVLPAPPVNSPQSNETKIVPQTEKAFANLTSPITEASIQYVHNNTIVSVKLPPAKELMRWAAPSADVPHLYQVYENDSEAEG